MEAFLQSLSLNLVYLVLLGAGVVYAVFILIGGGLSNLDIPGVDLPGGDVDLGGDVTTPEVKIPSLSPVTIASFITAFGAFGLISLGLFSASGPASLIWALVGGLAVAGLAHFAFTYFLIRPQGSSDVKMADIVGSVADVTAPIPAHSVGEIAFVAQGGRVTYTARSAAGLPIARGTTVVIEKVVGGVAIVRPQA
jgi:membrane protein implicated in regulation of membrane protease activity